MASNNRVHLISIFSMFVFNGCRNWLSAQLQSQTAQPSSAKNLPKLPTPPKVLIDQNDMYAEVFTPIAERAYTEKVSPHRYLEKLL